MSDLDNRCPACFEPKGGEPCGCDLSQPQSSTLLAIGTILSGPDDRFHYVIGRELGSGTFSITYLAWDVEQAQRTAIKEFLPREYAGRIANSNAVRPNSAQDRARFDHELGRFRREAEALQQFDHPNIIKVLRHFEANDTAYLVMPYHDVVSLADYLAGKGPMAPDVAVTAMLSVLDGLKHIHEKRVNDRRWTHRDIKPGNILLRKDGTPLLIDFGAARTEAIDEGRALSIVLTPGYAPCEQHIPGDRSDGPWVDVYGCAATLYEALTGVQPADSLDRQDALKNRQTDPLKPPHVERPEVSRHLSQIVMKGMEVEYVHRPQDASAFSTLLKSSPSLSSRLDGVSSRVRASAWPRRVVNVSIFALVCFLGFSDFALLSRIDAMTAERSTMERDLYDRLNTAHRQADAARADAAAARLEASRAQSSAQLANSRAENAASQLTAAQLRANLQSAAADDAERHAKIDRENAQALSGHANAAMAAANFMNGKTVAASGGGLLAIRSARMNLALSQGTVTVTKLYFEVDLSLNSDQTNGIRAGKKFEAFLTIKNLRTNVESASRPDCCWTYKGGDAFNDDNDPIKIPTFPCEASDIAEGNCKVGIWILPLDMTTGRGGYITLSAR